MHDRLTREDIDRKKVSQYGRERVKEIDLRMKKCHEKEEESTHSVCTHAPNMTLPSGGSCSANEAFSDVLWAVTLDVARERRERRSTVAALNTPFIRDDDDDLFLLLVDDILLLEEAIPPVALLPGRRENMADELTACDRG